MEFSSIQDFFCFINKNSEYVILRNWDNIINNISNGEDIDLLVEDKSKFINLVNATPKYKDKLRSNYYVTVGNKKIRLDVRSFGDGYYPFFWEKLFLKNRVFNKDIDAYTLNGDDYYSALLYHSLIQKPDLKVKYLSVLCQLSRKDMSFDQLIEDLRTRLKQNNSYISLPEDHGVYINMELIKDKELPYNFNSFDILVRTFRKILFKLFC